MENKKACLPTKKGSILAYSLIIIAAMLAIASSLSVTAVIEKKSASGTEFSMQSLQTADSGVQLALKKINAEFATPSGTGGELKTVGQIFPSCLDGKISGMDAGPVGSSYELTFLKKDGVTPVDCANDPISLIANIHSIGTYKNTVRAVDVSVAPPAMPCDATTVVNSFCSFDGLTYGTVMAANGKIWLDRNLGATQVAASVDDALAYGHYYQWGRGTDGHQLINSTNVSTLSSSDDPGHGDFIYNNKPTPATAPDYLDWRSDNNNNRWAVGTNDPCPSGFRVPTQTEWNTFRTNEGIVDIDTAFNSVLKIASAGFRNRASGSFSSRGTRFYLWSSTTTATNAYAFLYNATTVLVSGNYRANGFPVRCIKN